MNTIIKLFKLVFFACVQTYTTASMNKLDLWVDMLRMAITPKCGIKKTNNYSPTVFKKQQTSRLFTCGENTKYSHNYSY